MNLKKRKELSLGEERRSEGEEGTCGGLVRGGQISPIGCPGESQVLEGTCPGGFTSWKCLFKSVPCPGAVGKEHLLFATSTVSEEQSWEALG